MNALHGALQPVFAPVSHESLLSQLFLAMFHSSPEVTFAGHVMGGPCLAMLSHGMVAIKAWPRLDALHWSRIVDSLAGTSDIRKLSLEDWSA